MQEVLEWAGLFRRCRAVLEPQPGRTYFGRCDLKPHDPTIEHALERGMDVVRWRTTITRRIMGGDFQGE